jgi:Putative metallopeptidase
MEQPMSHRTRISSVPLVIVLCALLSMAAITEARSASRPNRIRIAYVPPLDVAHQPIYDLLKQRRILERFRDLLSFLRLPKPLLLQVAGCDGDANAWYDSEAHEVTVCYEYVAHIQRIAPTETTAGVTPENTIIGPVAEVFLHEVGHALFDLLRVPILGREEDAADQLAAYTMLQLGKAFARTTIVGVAWMYGQDAKGSSVDLSDYANVHSLDAQRFYNVLCLAYGADPKLFADIVEQKHLPQERAEGCADEYRQVDYAVQKLISPHIDKARAKKVRAKQWLRSELGGKTGAKALSPKP